MSKAQRLDEARRIAANFANVAGAIEKALI